MFLNKPVHLSLFLPQHKVQALNNEQGRRQKSSIVREVC